MSTKGGRRSAAMLYAAGLLYRDNGELAAEFSAELREIADGMLRRRHWPFDHVPGIADIDRALSGEVRKRRAAEEAK